MKKVFYIIVNVFFFITCSQEPVQDKFVIDTSRNNDNLYATIFLRKFKELPHGEDELNRFLKNQKPLFEYTAIGSSVQYGLYYMIPLQDIPTSIINGCLIYPVDFQKDGSEKSYNGILDSSPVAMDAEFLNHQIPITSRFLYSYHFFEWKEKDLPVKPDLTFFAEKLIGKEVPVDLPEESLPYAKTRGGEQGGWRYDIIIHYEVIAQSGEKMTKHLLLNFIMNSRIEHLRNVCMFLPVRNSHLLLCLVPTTLHGVLRWFPYSIMKKYEIYANLQMNI